MIISNLLVHRFIIGHLCQKNCCVLSHHVCLVFNYSYQVLNHWLKFLDSLREGTKECNSTCAGIHKVRPVFISTIFTFVLTVFEKHDNFLYIYVENSRCELMLIQAYFSEVFLPAEWMDYAESIDLQIAFFELVVEIENSFEDSMSLPQNNLSSRLILSQHLAVEIVNSEDDRLFFFVCSLKFLE